MQLTKIYKEPRVCPPVPPSQLVVSHQRSVVRIKQACDGPELDTVDTGPMSPVSPLRDSRRRTISRC